MICMLYPITRARHLVAITLQLPKTLLLDSGITSMTSGQNLPIFIEFSIYFVSVSSIGVIVL